MTYIDFHILSPSKEHLVFFIITSHVKISGKCNYTVFNKLRTPLWSGVVGWLTEKVHNNHRLFKE